MWSWCSQCRNCPWRQTGSHPEDLWGHLRAEDIKQWHTGLDAETNKVSLMCVHLAAVCFLPAEPAPQPAPPSPWRTRSGAVFSSHDPDICCRAQSGRFFPPGKLKTPEEQRWNTTAAMKLVHLINKLTPSQQHRGGTSALPPSRQS